MNIRSFSKQPSVRRSFKFASIYVGSGTIALFAMGSPLAGVDIFNIVIGIVLISTMPACFVGFGILWGEGRDAWPEVLLAQSVAFVIIWLLTYLYYINKLPRKTNEEIQG